MALKKFEEFIVENWKDDPRSNNAFAIGNLIIKDDDEIRKVINSQRGHLIYTMYGKRAAGHVEAYLHRLDEIYYGGGEAYRVVLVESMDDVNMDKPGRFWTTDKSNMKDYIWNLQGEYEEGYLASDEYPLEIPWENVKIALLTAKIDKEAFDPVAAYNEFWEFPEEKEIKIEDQSKIHVVKVEELDFKELTKTDNFKDS